MPKYRMLDEMELESLKDEFVKFLIVNGIAADDWLKIKNSSESDTLKMISLFSDVIFEGILRKIEYLEFSDRNSLKIFKCSEASITLIGVDLAQGYIFDFTDRSKLIAEMQSNPGIFEIYSQTKKYIPERNQELFRMTESGAKVTDQTWYEIFEKLL